jgi:hypothetical protein
MRPAVKDAVAQSRFNLCHSARALDLLPHLLEVGRAEGVAVFRCTPKRQLAARKIAGMQCDVHGNIGIIHDFGLRVNLGPGGSSWLTKKKQYHTEAGGWWLRQ